MTAKLTIDTRYKSKSNLYPVVIRVRSGEQVRHVKTGYKIPLSAWNKTEVKKNYPDASAINADIVEKLGALKSRIIEATRNNITDIDIVVHGESAPKKLLFSDYLSSRAQQYEDIHKVKHAKKLRLWIRNLQECLGKQDIPFDLTADDMRGFQAYLKKLGNDTNTVHKKFQLLGCLFNNAIAEGKTGAVNAFKNFKTPTKKVQKEKLTKKEITALEALVLPPGILSDCRNLFLFSYYCKGMRFEDCIRVKKDDIINNRIIFREIRKGHSQITVKLHDKLKALIDPYIESETPYLFPFLKTELMLDKGLPQTEESENERISKVEAQNVIMNRMLKVIAVAAGIKLDLTAHISRHSFAQHLKEAKVHVNVIKDALGHSSTAVTERYLKALDDAAIDEDVNQIYN